MGYQQVSFPLKNIDTSIFFLDGQIHKTLVKFLETSAQYSQKILITDNIIEVLYGNEIGGQIGAKVLSIPSGEKSKSINQMMDLIEKLFDLKVDKNALIIALGGGVVCDIAGFLASIYMRGISLILIPTTLLAMVDASIGGKTAIDYKFSKNFLGSFYFPRAIFIETNFLSTLSKKEHFCGLAEIIKLGIVYCEELLDRLSLGESILDVISKAAGTKLELVELDPYDYGIRRLLNYGHTIGHALEACSLYEITHGEAVAIGCVVEAHLSYSSGYLPQKDFEIILGLFRDFDLKLPKSYSREKMESFLKMDKKNENGSAHFVMIEKIGKACCFEGKYVSSVDTNTLHKSLNFMEEVYL
jgi:3-dehydroquinate synthase